MKRVKSVVFLVPEELARNWMTALHLPGATFKVEQAIHDELPYFYGDILLDKQDILLQAEPPAETDVGNVFDCWRIWILIGRNRDLYERVESGLTQRGALRLHSGEDYFRLRAVARSHGINMYEALAEEMRGHVPTSEPETS